MTAPATASATRLPSSDETDIDPRRAFGRPMVTGTRIPTEELDDRFRAGGSIEARLREPTILAAGNAGLEIPLGGIPDHGILPSVVAIRTFARRGVADFFFDGTLERRAGWVGIAKVVARKLDMVQYAQKLDDLRSPPANRLEALKGNWSGFYSIRVNDQWRIVFRWTDDGAEDVDVTDYHT